MSEPMTGVPHGVLQGMFHGGGVALALAGGSALGAYQAGAYAVLHDRGLSPSRVSGVSVGSINAAIIAGNPPERRVAMLRRFWEGVSHGASDWAWPPSGLLRRYQIQLSAIQARLFGNPSVFRLRFPGILSVLPGMPDDASLYDLSPLRARLEGVIDFDHLPVSPIRLTVTAVDVETGDEVCFDSREHVIRPDHLIASSGFLPDFPLQEIDGRFLCDGGMSANLPLAAVLEEPSPDDRLCIAIDLFSRFAPRPRSVVEAVERQLGLLLANQTRKAMEGLQQIHALRRKLRALEGGEPEGTTTLLYLCHRPYPHDLPMKSFDFSGTTIAQRWQAGVQDMERALDRLAAHRPEGQGLSILEVHGSVEEVERPSADGAVDGVRAA